MNVFNTEIHLITFLFIVSEFVLLIFQGTYLALKPWDKQRKYFVMLLTLLLLYNITGGLFPDPNLSLDIRIQNIIAYATGCLMGCYFPFYFYKAYDLKELSFHAVYGVFLFIILPVVIAIGIEYPMTGNLKNAVQHGMIVPFLYAILLLFIMLRAIKHKFKDQIYDSDAYLTYFAVIPWVTLPVVSYYRMEQWIEVLLTNLGFIIITILFIRRNMIEAWENERILENLNGTLSTLDTDTDFFLNNCQVYNFTPREIEIVTLLRMGQRAKDIGEDLYISETTVKKHLQNIYKKTGSKSKFELITKLEDKSINM